LQRAMVIEDGRHHHSNRGSCWEGGAPYAPVTKRVQAGVIVPEACDGD
jgi:hypothetical protein